MAWGCPSVGLFIRNSVQAAQRGGKQQFNTLIVKQADVQSPYRVAADADTSQPAVSQILVQIQSDPVTIRRKLWLVLTYYRTHPDIWDQIILCLLSSACSYPLTANLRSISNVCGCINENPTAPAPSAVPAETQRTRSSRLPHRRRHPMGSRPSRSSITSLNMQRAAAWFVDAPSVRRIPSAAAEAFHLGPSAGQFISYLI